MPLACYLHEKVEDKGQSQEVKVTGTQESIFVPQIGVFNLNIEVKVVILVKDKIE